MTAAPALTKALRFTIKVTQSANPSLVNSQAMSFEKPKVTIGRGPENDLVFSDDTKMSRSHVEIQSQSSALKVKNLSQKNFILINGEKLEEKILSKPFRLQIGDTVLQIDFQSEIIEPVLLKVVPQARVAARPQLGPPSATSSPSAYSAPAQPVFKSSPPKSDNRVKFYVILGVVGLLVWWLLNDAGGKKKNEVNVRTEGDVSRAIEDSANAVREIKKKQESSGQDSMQYKSAQEQYIKGFRDYRSGQYARALQSFQATLSFYPSHELARKYLVQAQRKFDASVDLNMSLGRKYYQKQNYKMCQASFANVMIMLKDSSKPKYKEARQLYEECNLRLEGRF